MDTSTNYYTILGINSDADQAEIESAYHQAVAQYDPAKLAGLASELQALARERRQEAEQAYSVLSDAAARTAYDRSLAAESSEQEPAAGDDADPVSEEPAEIDYRPLPPRRGGAATAVRPIAVNRRSLPGPAWLYGLAIVTLLLAAVSTATLLLTEAKRNAPQLTVEEMRAIARQTLLPPAVSAEIQDPVVLDLLAQQEEAIAGLEATASQSSDPNDWVRLGNAIFDYLEIIREQNPTGQAYAAVAPRWVKAADAYAEALRLEPDNGSVRSDYAMSLMRLYQAIGDESLRRQALDEAEKALRSDPDGLRTQLNVGMILSTVPERQADGLELLRKVIDEAPGSREASVAQRLLEEAP